MDESVRDAPEARPVNALVPYDPEVARRAKLRRAAGAARTALAVWGAVSLAGIGFAAVLHGSGGLDAFARTGAAEVVTVAAAEREPSLDAATLEPAPAAETAAPSAAPAPVAAAVTVVPDVPERREIAPAGRTGAATEEPAATPVGEPAAAQAEPPEPVALARLPRSRPKSIVVADTVARRDPAQVRWRIRKLEDLPLRYAYMPHHAYAAPPPRRMPPPLLYEW
jgi:hypothetical protein